MATPEGMDWEMFPSKDFPGEWSVGAWNMAGDGEGYFAHFSGYGAKEQAQEYLCWRLRLWEQEDISRHQSGGN